MKKFVLIIIGALMVLVIPTKAQESSNDGYNANSVYPVHEDNIMFKKRVWRRMDLREKQNIPFFASGNEITKHIIEAAQAGIIPIYQDDSLVTRRTKEEFLEALEDPRLQDINAGGGDDAWGSSGGDDWGSDDGWGDTGGDAAADEGQGDDIGEVDTKFKARDVSILEIMEDMIFDKQRSVLVWDMQAVSLKIPAENYTSGIEKTIGVFKYIDLVDLFRSNPEQMIWFNPQNSAEHKNLADAFALRLFSAHIIKVANPQNNMIIDIYNSSAKEGIMASQWIEYDLMEKEHELWSY